MSNERPWPNGAQCAVMLTFDFDAETLWTSRDVANWKRPGTMSQGTYGGKIAVPKILELLQDYGLKSTFFVPGWTAEKYVSRVEAVLRDGHEVAHHSFSHQWIDPEFPDKEREELEKGLDSLQRTVGVKPVGYRSPAGETSENMVELLAANGFLYDSSLMDTINPYRHRLKDGSAGPIELPWHWSLDDAIYALFSIKNPRPMFPNSHILDVWTEEFKEIYRWGGLVNLVMHPQVIGRPSRLALLRQFIEFAMRYPGVWFATGREVAEAWAATETEDTREEFTIG